MNKLTLDEYQAAAERTFIVEKDKIPYLLYGLASETGEVLGKAKRVIRDTVVPFDDMSYETRKEMAMELGDVLWYVATLAGHLQFDLSRVAEMNTAKLDRRMQADLITGSGDNR